MFLYGRTRLFEIGHVHLSVHTPTGKYWSVHTAVGETEFFAPKLHFVFTVLVQFFLFPCVKGQILRSSVLFCQHLLSSFALKAVLCLWTL